MSVNSLTGADTVVIDDRVLTDFADGDNAKLTYANEIANLKRGKNGNTVYAENATGPQADLVLRIIRGSSDDKYLQSRLADQLADFAAFLLVTGIFVKRVGDGDQNVQNDTQRLFGGIFVKIPETTSNVEGDTEQSLTIYTLRFSEVPRSIF
jgi:hypothetical protein